MNGDLRPYPEYRDSALPWLRKVPNDWNILRCKYLFHEVDERSTTGEETHLSMSQQYGLVPSKGLEGKRLYSESYVGGKLCRPSDLVLNRLKAHLGVFARAKEAGVVSPDYTVLRPKYPADVGFFEHVFKTPSCIAELRKSTKGIVEGFWRLYTDDFYNIRIPVPPAAERSAILRFVVAHDAQVRKFIRNRRRLIDVLNEQKQAIINRAVTRGLNPSVPLRPSGIDWLGDIPKHWEAATLGQLVLTFKTGPFGSILHNSDYVPGGVPLVNPIHMANGTITPDHNCAVSQATLERLHEYALQTGDIVFSRRGELGRCAMVRAEHSGWLLGTGSIRARLRPDVVDQEYLVTALQGRWVSDYLSLMSVGATMQSLNTGILKRLPVPLPPREEQAQIHVFIEREARLVNKAITKAEREIELIREYRTRLIADVVTGKVDVRHLAPPPESFEPEELAALDDDEALPEDLLEDEESEPAEEADVAD